MIVKVVVGLHQPVKRPIKPHVDASEHGLRDGTGLRQWVGRPHSSCRGHSNTTLTHTPANENSQALATGHDQCATQFGFFHRQCRIEFADERRKGPREQVLYIHDHVARKRLMQRPCPTFEDGCRRSLFGKLGEASSMIASSRACGERFLFSAKPQKRPNYRFATSSIVTRNSALRVEK